MIAHGKCKFCNKPLNLIVDDGYFELKEKFAKEKIDLDLIKLAACDRCADYRNAIYPFEQRIKKICLNLLGGLIPKSEHGKTEEVLTALCQKYMVIVAHHRKTPVPIWDASIAAAMMSSPGNFSLILCDVRRMCAQPTLV